MNKRKLYTLSLLFLIAPIFSWGREALFDSLPFPQGCTPFIIQRDTIICDGTSLTLKLLPPPPPDSMPGVWKQLITRSGMADSILFNPKPFGYNRDKQYLYTIYHQIIVRYDLKNNVQTSVPITGAWPGDYTEFTYDYTNKRLLCWRAGRDAVYAVSENGGSWQQISVGFTDNDCYGASSFWNPFTGQAGLYGGFGYGTMKNWVYENTVAGWIEKRPNVLPIDTVPKGGNLIGANADGSKLYLFSGQGSYTGNEANGCTLGSPWATQNGRLCWLRDLWEIDVKNNYTFTKILPVNSQSIQYEGAAVYDYDKSRFFIFGGFKPDSNYATNLKHVNTNKTYRFRRNIDNGFAAFQGEGDIPPALPDSTANGMAYYDPIGKRMIWARYDGIWAYYPDSTLSAGTRVKVQWSTGETTDSIKVTPTQTTQYKVTRTVGGVVCSDSVTITLAGMKTALQKNVIICADSALLDAGAGFSSYLWSNGATSQRIYGKQSSTYKVTVKKYLCTTQDSTKLLIAVPVKDFDVVTLKDSICTGETDSMYVAVPQTGVSYSWTISGNSTILHTAPDYKTPGIAKAVSFTVSGASNPAVCSTKTANAKVAVRVSLPKPAIYADSLGLAVLRFRWNPITAASGYSVSLDKGNTYQLPSSGLLGLTHTVTGLQPNDLVNLTVKTLGRYTCETSDTSQLSLRALNPFGNGIYIPNAFTPNGDGINDIFLVYGTAIASLRLMVYNQWGALVFESRDPKKGWDGTYKGNKAPGGAYTYVMEAIMIDGTRVVKNGTFALIR